MCHFQVHDVEQHFPVGQGRHPDKHRHDLLQNARVVGMGIAVTGMMRWVFGHLAQATLMNTMQIPLNKSN